MYGVHCVYKDIHCKRQENESGVKTNPAAVYDITDDTWFFLSAAAGLVYYYVLNPFKKHDLQGESQ